jgi:hypothetical protein
MWGVKKKTICKFLRGAAFAGRAVANFRKMCYNKEKSWKRSRLREAQRIF